MSHIFAGRLKGESYPTSVLVPCFPRSANVVAIDVLVARIHR